MCVILVIEESVLEISCGFVQYGFEICTFVSMIIMNLLVKLSLWDAWILLFFVFVSTITRILWTDFNETWVHLYLSTTGTTANKLCFGFPTKLEVPSPLKNHWNEGETENGSMRDCVVHISYLSSVKSGTTVGMKWYVRLVYPVC